MRIEKDSSGQFRIIEEPFRISGPVAVDFLEQMRLREEGPLDLERQRFLDECVEIYRRHQRSLSTGLPIGHNISE